MAVPTTADGFIEKAEEVLRQHPAKALGMQVADSHIVRNNVPISVASDAFEVVWREYDDALFGSIRKMVRYERSARAWAELLKGVGDGILRDTLMVDYVEPVFRMLVDLPLVFKDQLVKGAVKLSVFAYEDNPHAVLGGIGRNGWFKEFEKRVAFEAAAGELPSLVNRDLFGSDEAGRMRELHGRALHDSSPGLVEGRVFAERLADGFVLYGEEPPINLRDELDAITAQRLSAQKAYKEFDAFARRVACRSLEVCSLRSFG